MKAARGPQPDRAPMARPAFARSCLCGEYAFARELFPQAHRPAAGQPADCESKAATRLFFRERTPSRKPAWREGKPAPLALALRESPISIAVATGRIGIEPWPRSLLLLVWRVQHARWRARFDKHGFSSSASTVRIFGPAPPGLVPTLQAWVAPPDEPRWRASSRRAAGQSG